MQKLKLKTALAALAAASVLSALPAAANLITITGGAGSLTCNGATASQCQGFTGAGSPGEPTGLGVLSNTAADEYDGTPSSEADEAARLNILAGTSFTGAQGVRTVGSGGDQTFNTLALYVVMKIGNDAIFIKNISGGLLTIAYDSFTGQGSGLSHFTEFGTPEVPVPAAVWLMGAGLAGLGFAGRRKKSA
jgi:hypothetical protein